MSAASTSAAVLAGITDLGTQGLLILTAVTAIIVGLIVWNFAIRKAHRAARG